MSKRRIIKELPVKGVENKKQIIRVELYYNVGGSNFATGTIERRGYYLSVSPLELSGDFVVYTGFSGIKQLVVEAKRYGQKKFDSIEPSEEQIQQLVEHVLSKNNLSLVEERLAA